MSHDLLLRHCRLLDAAPDAPTVDVRIEGGRIAAMGEALPDGGNTRALDAGGRTLIPGLIDLHIHGSGGGDVLDADPEALRTMSRALARLGTTGFVGTTVMPPALEGRHLEAAAACVGAELGGARLLGLYIEGPFINPGRRGGIPAEACTSPSPEVLDAILARTAGTLRLMTVAPELPGALGVIERLRAAGVIPAFGHSAATLEQTAAGLEAGIGHVTHLFNAMPGLQHRDPGPLPALLDADSIALEIISDGVHVSPHVVRFAERAFGVERFACITDAMRTAGLPDGRYRYGDRDFESRNGTARYLDGTLIGTAISLLEVVRRFRDFTGCSLATALATATLHPARVLGLEHRLGSIAPGRDADLVLLDEDLSVWATLVAGEVVYGGEGVNG